MNICGLQHFASVWKEILVSLRRLPQSPHIVNTWLVFSLSEIEIRLCIKHTKKHSHSETQMCTQYTHGGGPT